MAWTEEKKALVVKQYADANPTAANTTEIVKKIAEEIGESPNGVRMVLTQAKVYVKKDEVTTSTSTTSEGGEAKKTGGTRVSKEASIKALKDAITAKGAEVDNDILDKLTGKAAVYLLSVLKA